MRKPPAPVVRRDPTLMSPAERLAEIAAILATAYRRMIARREQEDAAKALADRATVEAQCAPFNTPRTEEVA